jgi:hypothetical protein
VHGIPEALDIELAEVALLDSLIVAFTVIERVGIRLTKVG